VFDLIKSIASNYITSEDERRFEIVNESRRKVRVEFASDPDIRIDEIAVTGGLPKVSIEIKGGIDYSNAHNRLGEAEKSHAKAKHKGYSVFWTIIRSEVDLATMHKESRLTTVFFYLDKIAKPETPQHARFRDELCSVLGIRSVS
jgi:hypothetical protein